MYPVIIIHVIMLVSIVINATSIMASMKQKINIFDAIDYSFINRFILIRKQSDKFNYLNKNKSTRQYIWYKIIEKFSNNILHLSTGELNGLQTFITQESNDYNILLNKSGDILNIPPLIQKLIKQY